ncbi:hypothetical protein JZ751_025516 [Albula glossodonta]|uniref:Uncharacterized protein n=1 Tax=Albula glossodonta TaxID=121402 RepID=A0A8T2NM67_9TELE|nr:hypothetical protein JZ751_025516 [Albula glossodonta]
MALRGESWLQRLTDDIHGFHMIHKVSSPQVEGNLKGKEQTSAAPRGTHCVKFCSSIHGASPCSTTADITSCYGQSGSPSSSPSCDALCSSCSTVSYRRSGHTPIQWFLHQSQRSLHPSCLQHCSILCHGSDGVLICTHRGGQPRCLEVAGCGGEGKCPGLGLEQREASSVCCSALRSGRLGPAQTQWTSDPLRGEGVGVGGGGVLRCTFGGGRRQGRAGTPGFPSVGQGGRGGGGRDSVLGRRGGSGVDRTRGLLFGDRTQLGGCLLRRAPGQPLRSVKGPVSLLRCSAVLLFLGLYWSEADSLFLALYWKDTGPLFLDLHWSRLTRCSQIAMEHPSSGA